MQQLFTLLILLFSISLSAQHTLVGIVTDQAGEKLVGANIYLKESKQGDQTNTDGRFTIKDVPTGDYTIKISYVGFQTFTQNISLGDSFEKHILNFQLNEATLEISELIVSATRAEAKTPVTYSVVGKEEIEQTNLGQDVPYLLRWTPSTVVTSDAGTGIGYTGIRIRGSAPSRTNVTINGIPLNDAESQGVFWVNMPDFVSSAQDIQIQRGVGTSTNGAGAFGASINLNTNQVNREPYAAIAASAGSFNTLKGNVRFGSGLLNNKFTLDGRLSRITSDGFIDRASADLQSYYLSGAFVGEKSVLRLIAFSGDEVTYQAWDGVPVQYINDEELRTFNNVGQERAGSPHPNEVDDYGQDHYQALFSSQFNPNWNLNLALHYTKGAGFFEQYKAGEDFADYGLTPIQIGEEVINTTDLIRRRWLDNDFYGTTYSVNYQNNPQTLGLTVGGAWNRYLGGHFGEVFWARNASESEQNQRYYDNNAEKRDFNIFAKANYQITNLLNAYADVQFRRVDYEFLGFDNNLNNITQSADLNFFNPKAGLFYELDDRTNMYASFAVANREPNRDEFTESTPNSRPRPETLYDTELGFRKSWNKAALNINAYYMDYTDQLVATGELNDVGAAINVNVPKSYRAGIEIVGGAELATGLNLSGNATFSQNRVQSFTEFVDNWDTGGQDQIIHSDTDLAYSPNVIAGGELAYELLRNNKSNNLTISLLGKYVGEQFLDNTSNENVKLDAYFFSDLRFNYTLKPSFADEINFTLLVRNLFDARFSTNGWNYRYVSAGYDGRGDDPYIELEQGDTYHYQGLYPQAGRNVLLGVDLKF
ncbi:MAG: TonB-dependent receptor [Saprospiraceae bacterium]